MVSMIQVFKLAVEKQASDVHFTAGAPPTIRINGELIRVNSEVLTQEAVKELAYSLLSDEQKAKFEQNKSLDFSFILRGVCRFRGNLFYQKSSVAAAFRVLNQEILDFHTLGIPDVVKTFTQFPHGLVLVTGPTGAGKSTTLAACIDHINQNKSVHILTIEDPIEIIYQHKKSIVNQKEVGLDCNSFHEGLKNSMRVDPDIILVGEIRDRTTAEVVLALAETGHLVFSTLHTSSAVKTVDRFIGMFDLGKRDLIQNQLSTVLKAVVSQRLLPSPTKGRVVASEIMITSPAIQNLIREGKIYQIYTVIQTSTEAGMHTLNSSLWNLVRSKDITEKVAFEVTSDKAELNRLLLSKKKDLVA